MIRNLGLRALLPACLLSLAACSTLAPIDPESNVDLQRFMGRWYVIGTIPTPFEKGAHNAVETYQLDQDGSICTWFRQRPKGFDKSVELIHSTAHVLPESGNGRWNVRFFYLINAQYLVAWLKPDYSQVIVARDARDYFWFMARTPTVSESDYNEMLKRAGAMGYKTSKIVKVPQQWPETAKGAELFTGACS